MAKVHNVRLCSALSTFAVKNSFCAYIAYIMEFRFYQYCIYAPETRCDNEEWFVLVLRCYAFVVIVLSDEPRQNQG